MSRLLLIRHGMTAANERRAYCGWSDEPLSPAGRRRLEERRRSCRYPDISRCRVVTSGMLRTVQTLAVLYPGTPYEVCPEVREIHFGIFEGRTYEDLRDDPSYQQWLSGNNEANRCPGGESGQEMALRVLSAVRLLRNQSLADVALFTHGGPISCLMRHFFPQESRSRYAWQPDYGAGYAIAFDGAECSYTPLPEEACLC